MAKRKDSSQEEDEFSNDDETEEPKPQIKVKKAKAKSKGKGARVKKKAAPVSNTESSGEDEEQHVAKKPKLTEFQTDDAPSDKSSHITIKTNAEGEKYIGLGKKKRVTVRTFKGMPLVDIREFYGADGDEKPGKKGISLQPDQWAALKNSIDTVDGLFASLKKK